MQSRGLVFVAIAVASCAPPAQLAPPPPAPVAAASPAPSQGAPEPPLLDPRAPAPPRALGVELGGAWSAAAAATPELFGDGGLVLPQQGLTVAPLGDPDQQTLIGVTVTYRDAAALEAAVSGWGDATYVLRAGHCARVWLGPEGVRGTVAEPRKAAGGRCPAADAAPDLTATQLHLEEYWSVDTLLPPDSARWGFESERGLLGLTLNEVQQVVGTRLHHSHAGAGGGHFIILPPLNRAQSPTYVSLEFGGGVVRLLRVELPAVSNDPELAPESLLARLEARVGELKPVEPHVRLVSDSEPQLEVNVLGGPVSSVTIRDTPNCPAESVGDAERAIKSLGERWIDERKAAQPEAVNGRPRTHYINRGYRLGRRPAALVHERVHAPTCADNYWILSRNKAECEPETVEKSLWGTDCCDSRCEAHPKIWMMRLFNAVQGRDVKQLRRLIEPGGAVRITSARASGADEKSVELAEQTLSKKSFDRFPEWSPHGDGVQCEVAADDSLECTAGPDSYRMRFRWSGSASERFLDEINLQTR